MSTEERLVAYPVTHDDAGPLQYECQACNASIGASCVVWCDPVPGDVRHLGYVQRQVLEFHESRVRRE